MNAQRAAAAVGQHVEIATGLRCLDDPETGLLAGHREIPLVFGGDLQEDAAVGPALVGLPCRMQEAWTEFGAGGEMALVAHREPHRLQRVDMRGVSFDIAEQRDIVPRAGAAEMRLQPRAEVAVGAGLAQRGGIGVVGEEIGLGHGHDGLFERQFPRLLERRRQLPCLDLGVLDIGLVERVDPEHRTRHRGSHFEAEKLLADMQDRFHDDADHGMTGCLQRSQPVVMRGIVFALGADVDEETILAVKRGIAERFAVDRDQALAFLAGGFRDQLFGPGAEIGDFWG